MWPAKSQMPKCTWVMAARKRRFQKSRWLQSRIISPHVFAHLTTIKPWPSEQQINCCWTFLRSPDFSVATHQQYMEDFALHNTFCETIVFQPLFFQLRFPYSRPTLDDLALAERLGIQQNVFDIYIHMYCAHILIYAYIYIFIII